MRPGLKGLERAEFDRERLAHKASHLENLMPKNEESLTMRPRALGLTSLLLAFSFLSSWDLAESGPSKYANSTTSGQHPFDPAALKEDPISGKRPPRESRTTLRDNPCQKSQRNDSDN